MALTSSLEQNGHGPAIETPSETPDNAYSLIQTLAPFEQPTRTTTNQPPSRGRGRGGGSGRGRSRYSSIDRNEETENEWITPSQQRKNANQRRNKQRKLRQLANTHNQLENTRMTPYPKFYTMKFPRIEIESKINLIAVNRDIEKPISEPKKIMELNRDTPLIVVKSDNRSKKLKKVKKITDLEFVISEYQSPNQSQGTVYSDAMSNSSIDELLEALSDQHATKIERMKKKGTVYLNQVIGTTSHSTSLAYPGPSKELTGTLNLSKYTYPNQCDA